MILYEYIKILCNLLQVTSLFVDNVVGNMIILALFILLKSRKLILLNVNAFMW